MKKINIALSLILIIFIVINSIPLLSNCFGKNSDIDVLAKESKITFVSDKILLRAMLAPCGDISHRVYLFDLDSKGELTATYGDVINMKGIFTGSYTEKGLIKISNFLNSKNKKSVLLNSDIFNSVLNLKKEIYDRDALPLQNYANDGHEVTLLINNKIYSYNLKDWDFDKKKMCNDIYWKLIDLLREYSPLEVNLN